MKLRCHWTRKKLEAFQAGELPPAGAARVRAHLASCEACERERLTLERLLNKLDTLEGIQPSPEFESSFRRRVSREALDNRAGKAVPEVRPGRYGKLHPGWQWGMGLSSAAAILIMAFAYLLWGTVQFPGQNGGFTAPVEVADIEKNLDFYRDLEIIEEMGDFVGPELPADARRNGHS